VLEILRDTQALDLAYAQMFSMQRLTELRNLDRQRAQQKANTPLPTGLGARNGNVPLPGGLDGLLGASTQKDSIDLEWLKNYK